VVPARTLAHPWIVAAVATVVLAAAWLVAEQRPIPAAEVDVTRFVNDWPDWSAHALWPVMQLGTLWAPFVVAGVVGIWRRSWLLAGAIAAAGLVTWFAVRVLKHLADRGRPSAYLPDVHVRDGTAAGLGFPSGHAATAAALAVVCLAAIPRRHRWVLLVVAGLVGIARVVHGVHFPADVVGGWAFGTLVGVATLAVHDRLATRQHTT